MREEREVNEAALNEQSGHLRSLKRKQGEQARALGGASSMDGLERWVLPNREGGVSERCRNPGTD